MKQPWLYQKLAYAAGTPSQGSHRVRLHPVASHLAVQTRGARVSRIHTAIPDGLGAAPVGVPVAADLVRVDGVARGGVSDAAVPGD